MTNQLFLSHASVDKPEAQALRRALEDSGIAVWEDVLSLRAGDGLGDLEKAVKGSRGLLLLWTSASNESEWVEREAEWARQTRAENPEYKILAVLRGGGRVSAKRLLGEELVFIPVDGAVEDAVPEILRALGELPASGRVAEAPTPAPLLEELVISFSDARIDETGGRHRAAARFRLHHNPAKGTGSRSAWHDFESPLGPIEIEEIRWYLERYPGWPFGTFRDRAKALESKLPEWGRDLYGGTLGQGADQISAWRRASGYDRRVVVEVDDPGPSEKDSSGAAALLALPWELLADEEGYLFEGALSARVVRRIPRETSKEALPTADRLRVLLVIARPEQEGVAFLDPRTSARPLIEALAPLGHRAELEVLEDGTFPDLRDALTRAEKAGRPFHVVHFDGHGIYDNRVGLGMLCFENPEDAKANKLRRRMELVDAEKLGELLRDSRVPLFVIEACQTAKADEKVTASVAARLLRAGVASVLAMTHAVLVETARRFVGRFYERLAAGERIGTAMVAAEHYLRDEPYRGDSGGHGALHLQDWFVPVLFQEEDGDRQLLQAGSMIDPQEFAAQRRVREGELPPPPVHGFVGRAHQLLEVQRRLRDERYLTVLGEGGQGKTALAVECARWLLDLRRFERLAFATVEDLPGARLLLERLGHQLVPGYSVAKEEGIGTPEEQLRRARLPVERVLAERRVLLVIDNLESILPAPGQPAAPGLDEMLVLLSDLSQIGGTRLLLTSREAPPAPLDGQAVRLGRLSKREGRELVAGVLAQAGQDPAGDADEKWVDELIEAVDGHARSLVLLAPLVPEQGLQVTAESVARSMAELEKRHPGARELSLLASVRLSLDRLPQTARRQVRALAVFHGGVHFGALVHVLEVKPEEALDLCRQLVALGLAVVEGHYLFPDPALGLAVADELIAEERSRMEERWLEAMLSFIRVLYRMFLQDAEVVAEGMQAALKDLLAALARAEEKVESGELAADAVLNAVTDLRQLGLFFGRPAVLTQLEVMRQRLERRLGGWSRAQFNSVNAEIEQRLTAGDVNGAVQAAERLRELAESAGDADKGAVYARALAQVSLGRALKFAGRASDAHSQLKEADVRLRELAKDGNGPAARMLSVVAGDLGDALRVLGRYDEAAEAQERGIAIDDQWENRWGAAVGRYHLGIIRFSQGLLQEALDAFRQARQTFESLHNPDGVAGAWYQIGCVHQEAGDWDRAEDAYQSSLRMNVELGNKSRQALILNQLGILYRISGRLEESAQLCRQAATHSEELGDSFAQVRSLSNLASVLWELGRLDEALEAAIHSAHLMVPFGHAAEPWKTWNILYDIESLAGHLDAAAMARARAIELYAAYRRDGGAPQAAAELIVLVGQTLQAQGAEAVRSLIPPPDQFGERFLPVREALLAVIGGSRDPALARDARLNYVGVVELALLLESLAGSETTESSAPTV
ncbi:MAG TPA: CHAT domain-containing protein [Thermoanaerobaculia bacterium]|jgi:tetratricopeptide (TPR) repeat protein|nr:CHAT domain-containing protein [Thermoanaerobaculia bacterium]